MALMTHKAALTSDWLTFSKFQYGKNKEDTKDGGRKRALQVRTRVEVH